MGQLEELGMENLKDVLALEETCVFIFQLHGNWCQGSRRANVVRRLLPTLPSVLSVFPEKPERAGGLSDRREFRGLPCRKKGVAKLKTRECL